MSIEKAHVRAVTHKKNMWAQGNALTRSLVGGSKTPFEISFVIITIISQTVASLHTHKARNRRPPRLF